MVRIQNGTVAGLSDSYADQLFGMPGTENERRDFLGFLVPDAPSRRTSRQAWNHPAHSNENPVTTPIAPIPFEPVGALIRLNLEAPVRRFQILQQWEGVVTSVEADSLWGDLQDLTDPSNPLEIAEIPLREFALSDRPLLEPGSVFYWSIGHETTLGGQIRRVSEIRVRRTPVWSQQALDRVRSLGKQLHERFGSGSADSANDQRA